MGSTSILFKHLADNGVTVAEIEEAIRKDKKKRRKEEVKEYRKV